MVRWQFVTLLLLLFILGDYRFSEVIASLKQIGANLIPNPLIRWVILIFLIFFILFTYEIISYFRKMKSKIKSKVVIKERFK